ncbi:TRAP transporter small permease [Oribacterium sp. WCC10]|uniref:TRAP transporter small permease n=1 Tax=Oribacterium sp. WCC10 TaxID=1855343 RepID=UPI0008E9B881|nr:TRAP transporter small permease [Oribacterium sp. WCC10]SFG49096.1 TRAP-type C4-dicarboxylate transport system, small permease component [Oribacterium sp. WCC10]
MKKFILKNPEEAIAALLIVITTVLVLINVFFRYFLNKGIYWSEEVATTSFVWAIFIGGAGAYRNNTQLGIDLLVNMLPEILQKIVKILVQIVLFIVNAYILYLACIYVDKTHKIATSVLGVSSAWVSSSLIVGFGLTTLYTILHLINMIRDFSKKRPD